MSRTTAEIATQPDCWRAAAAARRRAGTRARRCLPTALEVAVVGCGTSLFMAQAYAALREACRPGAHRRVPGVGVPRRARPTRSCSRSAAPARRPRSSRLLRAAAGRERLAGDHRRRRHAGAGGRAARRSSSTSPTRSRWCRRASRRRRWRSCARRSATTSAAVGERRGARARGAAAARPRRIEQVSFLGGGWTFGLAERGRPEAARGGPVLGRVVSRDGVPARADQHRGAGPGGVAVLGAAARPRRPDRRHGRHARATPATSTRWRRSSWPSASRSPPRRPAASIPTSRGRSPARSSCPSRR